MNLIEFMKEYASKNTNVEDDGCGNLINLTDDEVKELDEIDEKYDKILRILIFLAVFWFNLCILFYLFA